MCPVIRACDCLFFVYSPARNSITLPFFGSDDGSSWFYVFKFVLLCIQETEATEEAKKSKHVEAKIAKRVQGQKLDSHLEDQFASGRLLACISSRPGQCGRSDGYVVRPRNLCLPVACNITSRSKNPYVKSLD